MSFTWSQRAGSTGPFGHCPAPGSNIGLQQPFPASGSLPSTWDCLDCDDIRVIFRLTLGFLVHMGGGGGASSGCSARCRSASANFSRIRTRSTGRQIIEIPPQLLQSTHRCPFSIVLRYLQITMSIYLQRLADSDDHAPGTGMVSPVPTQACSEFSLELHLSSVHQRLPDFGPLGQCTTTHSGSSLVEAIFGV